MPTLAPDRKDLQADYYCDVVAVWLTKPLPPAEFRRLRTMCGSLHDRNGSLEPLRGKPEFIYRLSACQPSPEYLLALHKLEASQPVRITYVELARDEICGSRRALEALHRYRNAHELQLWCPKGEIVEFPNIRREAKTGNTYHTRRSKARGLGRYMEHHSRRTGECDCLHSEFRISGYQSLQRAGIANLAALIGFNHKEWWRSKTRFVSKPDLQRLGRMLRNMWDRTRYHTSPVEVSQCGRFSWDMDWRSGSTISDGAMSGISA
jgi:hypothetical protein